MFWSKHKQSKLCRRMLNELKLCYTDFWSWLLQMSEARWHTDTTIIILISYVHHYSNFRCLRSRKASPRETQLVCKHLCYSFSGMQIFYKPSIGTQLKSISRAEYHHSTSRSGPQEKARSRVFNIQEWLLSWRMQEWLLSWRAKNLKTNRSLWANVKFGENLTKVKNWSSNLEKCNRNMECGVWDIWTELDSSVGKKVCKFKLNFKNWSSCYFGSVHRLKNYKSEALQQFQLALFANILRRNFHLSFIHTAAKWNPWILFNIFNYLLDEVKKFWIFKIECQDWKKCCFDSVQQSEMPRSEVEFGFRRNTCKWEFMAYK